MYFSRSPSDDCQNPASLPVRSRCARGMSSFPVVTLNEFVVTRHVNRVRDPDGYDRMARAKQTVFTGMLVNQMI